MRRAAASWLFGCLLAAVCGAACSSDPPPVVLLSLDGVSFEALQQARRQGAFAGWPPTSALVAPFPSSTNVSFAAILRPLGMEPIAGYEASRFDPEENRIVSGIKLGEYAYGWRDYYDLLPPGSIAAKAALYLAPKRRSAKMFERVEATILASDERLVLAHVAATDVLAHFGGQDAVVASLLRLSERLERVVAEIIDQRGRAPRLVLFSDHGNSWEKIRCPRGLVESLERAGFRRRDHLEKPTDVVLPLFGLIGFGVVYGSAGQAESVARAVAAYPGVDFAAWRSDEERIRLVTAEGEATIRWRGPRGERRFSYEPLASDPLQLTGVRRRLAAEGLVDERGFSPERAWFEQSAFAAYPDAPRRLVDSLTGAYVSNPGTVVFSFEPGYACGLPIGRLGAWFLGGRMEGTHGGLDRASSLGILLTNDARLRWRPAVTAERALDGLLPTERMCGGQGE